MPKESAHFRCPCCGQHAPVERLTEEGPFEPAMFTKTVGGKRKMTTFEREDRKGKGFRRGSAPGQLEYDEIPMTDDFREALARRIAEL